MSIIQHVKSSLLDNKIILRRKIDAYPVNAASPFNHGDSSEPPASAMMLERRRRLVDVVEKAMGH